MEINKILKPLGAIVTIVALAWFILGYRLFPAINPRNLPFYIFLVVIVSIILTINKPDYVKFVPPTIILIILIVFTTSSTFTRAKNYVTISDMEEKQKPEERLKSIKKDEIPTIDRETADRIGNRAMGTIPELAGIYQSPEYFTTIIYKDRLTRVAPLEYSGIFSWFKNNNKGIPAYITVDMATGKYELVRLKEPMKYSAQEYFKRDIMNILKRKYITKLWFNPSFELDDKGHPYWVVPEKINTIGLFGGVVGDVYIVDAINGEIKSYNKDKLPDWIDRVYQTNDYLSYVRDKGMLSNGALNSIMAKTGTYKPTSSYESEDEDSEYDDDGFSYIELKDENGKPRVYTYTGITSGADNDKSNMGFVLMNNRTGKVEKYTNAMVEEYSAMTSAQGSVQEKGYKATFPTLLVNNGNFIYFMNLKDQAGLTKGYAIVDADDYQKVYLGNSVVDVFNKLDGNKEIKQDKTAKEEKPTKTSKITVDEVYTQVKDGNTEYILLSNSKTYVLSAKDDHKYKGITIKKGDTLEIDYEEKEYFNQIKDLK